MYEELVNFLLGRKTEMTEDELNEFIDILSKALDITDEYKSLEKQREIECIIDSVNAKDSNEKGLISNAIESILKFKAQQSESEDLDTNEENLFEDNGDDVILKSSKIKRGRFSKSNGPLVANDKKSEVKLKNFEKREVEILKEEKKSSENGGNNSYLNEKNSNKRVDFPAKGTNLISLANSNLEEIIDNRPVRKKPNSNQDVPADVQLTSSHPGSTKELSPTEILAPRNEIQFKLNSNEMFTAKNTNPIAGKSNGSQNKSTPSEVFGSQNKPTPSEIFGSQNKPTPSEIFGIQSKPTPSEIFGSQNKPIPSENFGSQNRNQQILTPKEIFSQNSNAECTDNRFNFEIGELEEYNGTGPEFHFTLED